jgi:hypothetical protein
MHRRSIVIFLLPLLILPLAADAAGAPVYLPAVYRSPTATNNLAVTTATYLGATGADSAAGVDIAPDGSIVYGGGLAGGFNPGGVTPAVLLSGGDGAVVRLAGDGRAVRSVTRIGATVSDLEVNDAGQIAVCGDFGVVVLSADASRLVWNATPGAVTRCAIGIDGTTAALSGGNVYIYGATGQALGSWNVAGTAAFDIAVDGTGKAIIVCGYTQVTGTLQVAYLRAWSYTGAPTWTSYGFSAAEASGYGADTRGERVAIGRDGKLYFAGSINGGTGASIFVLDPQNPAQKLGSNRNIETDTYNRATNVGSVKMTWFGRYDPASGALELGSSLLTRLSSGRGNSIVVKAIAADETGQVFLAGDTACCLQNRDTRQVAGTTVGSYEGGEAFVLVVTPDLKQRLVWTPFAGPGTSAGGSPAVGIGTRGEMAAVAITLNQTTGSARRLITTAGALQAAPGGGADGYLAVWPD